MPDDAASSPEQLGRSYGDMLEQQSWQMDAIEPVASSRSPEAPETATPPSAIRIVEALLFVGGPPLSPGRACEAIRGLTEAQFLQFIDTLNHEYHNQGRPYHIQSHGNGYQLTLRPKYRPVVEKIYGTAREARLSTAAIDVLALVAYRQPATKQEIDSLRGAESGGILRQLIRRGLVAVVHRGEAGQREVYYGTTARFLELFELTSLDDLPQTQDLQRL